MEATELKSRIEAAGISVERLAGEANVSINTVRRFFSGEPVRRAMADALAHAVERLSAPAFADEKKTSA